MEEVEQVELPLSRSGWWQRLVAADKEAMHLGAVEEMEGTPLVEMESGAVLLSTFLVGVALVAVDMEVATGLDWTRVSTNARKRTQELVAALSG